MPYKKEKQKSESAVRMLQGTHLKHLEEEGNCRGVAAEANSQLQPDACWTSVNCAFDFKGERKLKNMYKIQTVTQCLPLGMFWTISTRVLPVLNFPWSGVHLRCLITAALAANQMSGHLVRVTLHFPSTLPWRGTGCIVWQSFSSSRCLNVGNIHWRQNALWEKHQLWSGNHGYSRPPTPSAEVGVQICIRGDAEVLAGGITFFGCFFLQSLKHSGIRAW